VGQNLRAGGATFAALLLAACTHRTPLDDYVAAPDANFAYAPRAEINGDGATATVYEMTSQEWRGIPWRHWLTVVRPEKLESDFCLLMIGGGKNTDPPPAEIPGWMARTATAARSIVAELRMVPNQPITFDQPRSEDSLLAYGQDQYLKTGDPTWIVRLPMTKSAVRAMDAIAAVAGARRFVVAGGSKRGWTSWTTAAVDPRVAAVIPIVIDVLNVRPSMKHHHAAYGFWAPAIHDYEETGLMEKLEGPGMDAILAIDDPYSYRDRFTMPKFILNATGDQFFLPDSSQFYFDDLPGPKWLRYVPNADHSLKNTDARESISAFFRAIVEGRPLPRLSWSNGSAGLAVRADPAPDQAILWQATNPDARDFRLEKIGPAWTSRRLEPDPDGAFSARVPPPPRGWTAYLIELKFGPHTFTTPVVVTPDTLPHASR
jgi:PhoPQ-activated pathogenicity-related protein